MCVGICEPGSGKYNNGCSMSEVRSTGLFCSFLYKLVYVAVTRVSSCTFSSPKPENKSKPSLAEGKSYVILGWDTLPPCICSGDSSITLSARGLKDFDAQNIHSHHTPRFYELWTYFAVLCAGQLE
jgi:hypothetical protein